METTHKGRAAESLAAVYLEKHSVRILERNYRSPYGEVDLIAIDHATICFVEVRSRRSVHFLSPIVSITASKQRRIAHTAQHFLAMCQTDSPCRFDVVEVIGAGLSVERIIWTRDAFRLDGSCYPQIA